MEQPQAHMMPLEHLDEADLGLVELPARGDKTAILVAVGIAEHHFLHRAAGCPPACGSRAATSMRSMMALEACKSSMVSNSGTMLIALRPDGLIRPTSFKQHGDLEHVGHALAHRDDALLDRLGAELRMRLGARRGTAPIRRASPRCISRKPNVSGRALRSSPSSSVIRASSPSAR